MDEIELKIQALRAEADRLEKKKQLENSLPCCPFCGGKPHMAHMRGEWDDADKGTFYVVCTGCGCSTKERKSEGDAVRSWEKRV